MKKIAALDLGTNTFLCLIGLVEGKELTVIEDVAKVVRLGEKVNETGMFQPQALARAAQALDFFLEIIKKHDVDHIVATATSAARDVKNGSELLELGRARNISISIIPGAREAELSFEGAISSVPEAFQKNIFVVDVGGGSTELIFRKAGENQVHAKSFDVGCVRLTEKYIKKDPVDPIELEELSHEASETLKQFGPVDADLVIAVAGTPTTLAAVEQKIEFHEQKVEGFILTKHIIEKLIDELGSLDSEARKTVTGLEPMRADIIVAGAVLLLSALEVVNKTEMRVSTRGLRYGVILNYQDFI